MLWVIEKGSILIKIANVPFPADCEFDWRFLAAGGLLNGVNPHRLWDARADSVMSV